jgi:hypothetical protein
MSAESDDEASDDSAGAVRRAYRRTSPLYGSRPNAEMDGIGWSIFLGILVLLVPLLPFFLIVWLLEKLIDVVAGRRGTS